MTPPDPLRGLAELRARAAARRDRVQHLAKKGLGWLRARALLGRGVRLGRRVVVDGGVHVIADGAISLDDGVLLLEGPVAIELIAHDGAQLVVGEGAIVNYGASFEATRSITIGRRCMFGSYARLVDDDAGKVAPIVLEDEVWVAHGAYVGPGVTLGKGAVVAAGAVVTSDVPAGRLAIGNPARAIPLDLVDKSPANP